MNIKIYFLSVCFILSMWAGIFAAEAADDNSTEYEAAIKILREKDGDREIEEALKLFIRGCDKNHVGSCLEAGSLSLYSTDSTPANYVNAEKYLAKACSLGSASACLSLGFNYYKGDNMFSIDLDFTVDINKALSYFEQACEKGEPVGCHTGADIYYNDQGIPANKGKALMLASKGCNEYKCETACGIKEILEEEQKSLRTFAQIRDDCKKDNASACLNLGEAYLKGESSDWKPLQADKIKAVEYYAKACNLKSVEGCNIVAGLLINEGEYTEAEEYSAKSCKLKDPYGCFLSGKYRFEIFTNIKNDKNATIGLKDLEKSCDLGFAEGCSLLGDMYYHASEMLLGGDGDNNKAIEYYIKSCNLADFSLANPYARGCAQYIEIKAGELMDLTAP